MTGQCPLHPEATDVVPCSRCGDYACDACVTVRVHIDRRYCPECEQRRAEHIEAIGLDIPINPPADMALFFALGSLIPGLWLVWAPALVLGVVGLYRSRTLGGRGV